MLTLHVEVTSRCPLRCLHCYNDRAVADALDLATLESVLDDAMPLGCLFVVLTGGEVYARPDFEQIVSAARRREFDVRCQTSGWHLDDHAAGFLAERAVSEVHISVYSDNPAVHDAVTRMPGSHARALRAVHALRRRGVRVLIKSVVTEVNAASYRSVQTLARSLGCACSIDPVVVPCESGACGPCGVRPPDDILREFYGEYAWSQIAAAFSGSRARGALRPLDDAPCLAGATSLFLASDGTIYPCVDLKIPCGSVLTESLACIWRGSPGLRRVRDLRWRDLPVCAACQVRDYCNHCLAVAQNEHGDLLGPALENCRHALVRRDLLRERGLVAATETAVPPPLAVASMPGGAPVPNISAKK
ncbi:MAG: radical SAM protein [Deltaproteobacteria bacterium]|nr:radical SAM protein [Deltaproteobacteria bacterium]